MLDFISNAAVWSMSWWNAGGFFTNTYQIQEYVNSRMEVWAYSKVK